MSNKEELKEVAHEAVKETMMVFGVDVDDHESIRETQADLLYMRKLRQGSDDLTKTIKKSAIGIALLAMAYVLWQGVKSYIGIG